MTQDQSVSDNSANDPILIKIFAQIEENCRIAKLQLDILYLAKYAGTIPYYPACNTFIKYSNLDIAIPYVTNYDFSK